MAGGVSATRADYVPSPPRTQARYQLGHSDRQPTWMGQQPQQPTQMDSQKGHTAIGASNLGNHRNRNHQVPGVNSASTHGNTGHKVDDITNANGIDVVNVIGKYWLEAMWQT